MAGFDRSSSPELNCWRRKSTGMWSEPMPGVEIRRENSTVSAFLGKRRTLSFAVKAPGNRSRGPAQLSALA
jgi:hypothetical protein